MMLVSFDNRQGWLILTNGTLFLSRQEVPFLLISIILPPPNSQRHRSNQLGYTIRSTKPIYYMVEATAGDKALIVDILSEAFLENKSVNYLVPQDRKRRDRLRKLIEYSFDICRQSGKAVLSDDRKACALLIFPERKKTTLKTIGLMVDLIRNSIGVGNIIKAARRESRIAARHPQGSLYHLWFIGVSPEDQGKGSGGRLLKEIQQEAGTLNRTVVLETSTLQNLPWYEKHGFTIYDQLEFTYTLYLLKWTK
jgi:ribosomal protein S18 acetylase RimI-like enzyme